MVLMIIIAMIVLTISVFSMNISQVKMAEGGAKQVQAEILGRGLLFKMVAQQETVPATDIAAYDTILSNTTYTSSATRTPDQSGINNTDPVRITVSY